MKSMPTPAESAHAPFQGPHRGMPEETEFVPLRLLLVPGGLAIDLDRPDMLVGRHSEADVRLALPDVSRRHCRVVFQNGFWKIIDLNSLNGTFVNGERMHEAMLYHGDEIRLGGFTFQVQLENKNGAKTSSGPQGLLQSIADVLPLAGPEQRQAS